MWRITVVLSLGIVLLLATSGWYYKQSQQRIEALSASNASLLLVSQTNQNTINEILAQQTLNEQHIRNLNNKLQEAETYNTELRKILQKHDLTRLAEQRPGLIERRINDGTRKVFDSLMLSTISR